MDVRCKIVLDIETSFDDELSTPETLLYCLQEDFNEVKSLSVYTIHSAEIIPDDGCPKCGGEMQEGEAEVENHYPTAPVQDDSGQGSYCHACRIFVFEKEANND